MEPDCSAAPVNEMERPLPVKVRAYEPDPIALQELIEQNYITKRSHRRADLHILNYTAKTQYGREWNEHTRACRGLIVDSRWNVVQRPFTKFFNLGEQGTEWLDEPFEVYEKMDGSLGILYWGPDGPAIATRGSFQSQQATEATRLLREKYSHLFDDLDPLCTYLFEIILPENRIVVDYGETRDLVLLAVIDTMAGNELPLVDTWGFPVAKLYEGFDRQTLELAQLEQATNREGFVVRWQSGQRAKIKLAEYMTVHRLVTQVTPRRIWERLSQGDDLSMLKTLCPPQYCAWIDTHVENLTAQYDAIERQSKQIYHARPDGDRKAAALYFQQYPNTAVLFRMLDGRPYDDVIWKAIYPPAAEPFKVEV